MSALLFGWDKEKTDTQPVQYLTNTIFISLELIETVMNGFMGGK